MDLDPGARAVTIFFECWICGALFARLSELMEHVVRCREANA
jgi:hypothetical protein